MRDFIQYVLTLSALILLSLFLCGCFGFIKDVEKLEVDLIHVEEDIIKIEEDFDGLEAEV